MPTAPVREKVRGICDVHSISTLTVSPVPTGDGSGTIITVRSSAFPSSGAMKRCRAVRSTGGAEPGISRMAVTSIHPQSCSARAARRRSDSRPSRSHVDDVFFQAL